MVSSTDGPAGPAEGSESVPRRSAAVEAVLAEAADRECIADDRAFCVERVPVAEATMRVQIFSAAGARPVVVAVQEAAEGVALLHDLPNCVSQVWRCLLPGEDRPPIWVHRFIVNPARPAQLYLVPCVTAPSQTDPYAVHTAQKRPISRADLERLVGRPVDVDRGGPAGPRMMWVDVSHYEVRWVVWLPRPEPFRQEECMRSGIPLGRRLARQLRPDPVGRNCCWFHTRSWKPIMRMAIKWTAQGRRDAVPADEVAGYIREQGDVHRLRGWDLEALRSLVDFPIDVTVDTEGSPMYVNGQHRCQALMDQGVRRVLTVRTETLEVPGPAA